MHVVAHITCARCRKQRRYAPLDPTYCYDCFVRREQLRIADNYRRAHRAENPATLTYTEWLKILGEHQTHCHWCGGDYECIDHVVPLSRGGGTTARNCVPSCRRCNALRDRLERVEDIRNPNALRDLMDFYGVADLDALDALARSLQVVAWK